MTSSPSSQPPSTPRSALRNNIDAVFPVSPIQEGLLFHSVEDSGRPMYLVQLVLSVTGALCPQTLAAAWNDVIAHNPVLRTAFVWKKVARPAQVVQRQVGIEIDQHDLRDCPPAARADALERLLAQDRATPFALNKAPLMRVLLVRLEHAAWRVVWTHHHILLDGWSVALVMRDVFASYRRRAGHGGDALPARASYQAYLDWTAALPLGEARRFWRGQLAGLGQPSDILGGAHDAARSAFSDSELRVSLERARSDALRACAQQQRVTVGALVLAAWALLIGDASGSDDVVLGLATSGRPPAMPGVEQVVGMCVATVPLRVRLDWDASVTDWLRALQEQIGLVQEHQQVPLSELAEMAGLSGRRQLFNHVVAFENYPMAEALASVPPDWTLDAVDLHQRANYPFGLIVVPGDRIELRIPFDSTVLPQAEAGLLLHKLGAVLDACVDRPGARLADLLDGAVAAGGPAVAATAPCAPSMLAALVRAAGAQAQRPALRDADGALSYGELLDQVYGGCAALAARGLAPGARVAVCADTLRQLLVCVLAIEQCGGVCVLVDADAPSSQVAAFLRGQPVALAWHGAHCRHAALRHHPGALEIAPGAGATAPAAAPAAARQQAFLLCQRGAQAVAITHAELLAMFGWLQAELAPAPGERALLASPARSLLNLLLAGAALMQGADLLLAAQPPGTPAQPPAPMDQLARLAAEHRAGWVYADGADLPWPAGQAGGGWSGPRSWLSLRGWERLGAAPAAVPAGRRVHLYPCPLTLGIAVAETCLADGSAQQQAGPWTALTLRDGRGRPASAGGVGALELQSLLRQAALADANSAVI